MEQTDGGFQDASTPEAPQATYGPACFPPDTRATVSLMAYRVAQQNNLFVNKLKNPSLVNASGLPMKMEGIAKVTLCANEDFI